MTIRRTGEVFEEGVQLTVAGETLAALDAVRRLAAAAPVLA